MKMSYTSPRLYRVVIFAGLLCGLAVVSVAGSAAPATSLNIVNNSSREIRNVYVSPVNSDDWSNNQLGESIIGAGQSYSLNVAACDQQEIKVIGEDSDGCFVTLVIQCGSSASWTISNDTARDCGSD